MSVCVCVCVCACVCVHINIQSALKVKLIESERVETKLDSSETEETCDNTPSTAENRRKRRKRRKRRRRGRGGGGRTDPSRHVSSIRVVVMILQNQNCGDDRQTHDHHGGGKVLS